MSVAEWMIHMVFTTEGFVEVVCVRVYHEKAVRFVFRNGKTSPLTSYLAITNYFLNFFYLYLWDLLDFFYDFYFFSLRWR